MLIVDSAADLDPLIQATVAKTLEALRDAESQMGDQLAYDEGTAARLIGLEIHQLRDERRRGRVGFTSIVGRRIRYQRQDLIDYLLRNRSEPRI